MGTRTQARLRRMPLVLMAISLALGLLLSACSSADDAGDGDTAPDEEPAEPDDAGDTAEETETDETTDEEASEELTPLSLATSSNSMTAGPVLAALSLDTFADNGIEMEEVAMGGSSPQALAALLSGETQFAFFGGTSAFDARAEGAPIVVLGPTATSLLNLGLSTAAAETLADQGVTPDSSVEERVQALEGLTIATSPPGSLSFELLVTILEIHGVAEDALQIVPSEPGAMVAGINEGLYDGVFWPVGVLEQAYADGDAQLWISVPRGDVPELPDFMQGVVATTESFIAESPELVDAFRQSIIDANTAVQEQETAAQDAVKAYAFDAVDQSVFEEQWAVAKDAWIPSFSVSQELFDTAKELQEIAGEGDYTGITYEDFIAESARS